MRKVIVVLTFLLLSVSNSQAGNQKVLYSFTGGLDGGQPYAGVIFDPAGNLYGVTRYGGIYNQGTVFELSPAPGGTWTETVLYNFTGGEDGSQPVGGLATDGAGDLYGTASLGGTNNDGCGTVFQLNASGVFGVLHTFSDLTGDGCQPQADLNLIDGNIYGTTIYGGGPHEPGTVFTLGPGVYVSRPFRATESTFPNGLGVFGNGATYGTTLMGGKPAAGNVFELSWPMKSTHIFALTSTEGVNPVGDLDTQVNANGVRIMYGATSNGASGRSGAIYQLTESQYRADIWAISLLHSFSGADGANPAAGVILDTVGNLYGTTSRGGANPGYDGTVFKLTPSANNTWIYTLLYSFSGGVDGGKPVSTLVLDNTANIYGTTVQGGIYNQGVVYQVTPPAATTITLTGSPNPSSHKQAVNFNVVVASSAGTPPDGELVTLLSGKKVLAAALLTGGTANFVISTLPVGTHSIVAVYDGDLNFSAGASNVVAQVVLKATN